MKKWLGFLLFFTGQAFATFGKPVGSQGVGKLANNLMDPVAFASDFIYTGCLIVGASFILGGIVKYMEYRRNPFATTMSTVVFLFLCGALLIAMPFMYLLVNHATPYSLFK